MAATSLMSNHPALKNITARLKDALLGCSEEELAFFFAENFEKALRSERLSKLEIPAEYLRHQEIQTEKIKNILLTLRRS